MNIPWPWTSKVPCGGFAGAAAPRLRVAAAAGQRRRHHRRCASHARIGGQSRGALAAYGKGAATLGCEGAPRDESGQVD